MNSEVRGKLEILGAQPEAPRDEERERNQKDRLHQSERYFSSHHRSSRAAARVCLVDCLAGAE